MCVQYPWGHFTGNRLCVKHIVPSNNCSGRSLKWRTCPIMICHARGARRCVKKQKCHTPFKKKTTPYYTCKRFNSFQTYIYTQNICPTGYVHQFCEGRRQIPLVFIGNLILSLFYDTSHGGTLTWVCPKKKKTQSKTKLIIARDLFVFRKGSISGILKI